MEDRILEIAAELTRIENRRRELLAELERLSASSSLAEKRRKLIEEIVGSRPEQRTFAEVSRSFNLLDEIRNLLASQPLLAFPARQIRQELHIPASMEKSLYAALAKLTKTGQILRVSRAVYKAAGTGKPPARGRKTKQP
jgi:hypothetical protein